MCNSEYRAIRNVLVMKGEAVEKAHDEVNKLRGADRASFIIAVEIYEKELREYEHLKQMFSEFITEGEY